MTTKIIEIDGLPDFLRCGASLAHLWRAEAPVTFKRLGISTILKSGLEPSVELRSCSS